MKTNLGRRSGFTLIELLVVVVIIGILAGVGMTNFSTAQDKARNSGVISSTRSVFLGVESWKADYPGRLPYDLMKTGAAGAPAGWPAITGSDSENYVAAANDTEAGTFPAKYVPGALLPMSPWASKPQQSMDGTYNNVARQADMQIGQKIKEGEPLATTQGYFIDGGGNAGAGPPPAGQGTSKRDHFGYYYYVADLNSGRYAIFGVGKHKKEARVFAVKANF